MIVVEIPKWHPARLNAIVGHWGKRSRLKKADRELVWAYTRNIAPAAGKRRVSLIIVLAGRQKVCDPDAYWKSLLDALVQARMLVDDSPEWVELGPVEFMWARDTTYSQGTIILLDDIT